MSATTSDAADGTVTEYLADHPRVVGMLFALLLLLSQSGNAAACVQANAGP